MSTKRDYSMQHISNSGYFSIGSKIILQEKIPSLLKRIVAWYVLGAKWRPFS